MLGTHTSGTSQTHAKSRDADLSSFGSALNLDTEVGEQSWGLTNIAPQRPAVRGKEDWRFVGAELTFELGDSQTPEVHATPPGVHPTRVQTANRAVRPEPRRLDSQLL